MDEGSPDNNSKVIKHALRQQAKRRRKNTTIATGNSHHIVPRIIVKPLPPQPPEESSSSSSCTVSSTPTPTPPARSKYTTMREVLASIPGFNMKPRKRTNKKLSTAAQLEQTKEGCIDLETPDSILVNTNLRALLNKYTFASLPPLYQHKLVHLLPSVDRPTSGSSDVANRLSASGLNNEFFARACLEWQERLAEGEFTPENQQKLKSEADKERSRLDPWKLKHFEPIWGDRGQDSVDIPPSVREPSPVPQPPLRTTIKLRPTTSISHKTKPTPLIKRLRTAGAITRSCTNYKIELETCSNQIETITKSPIPDLLPIKTHKGQSLLKSHKEHATSKQEPEEVISTENSNLVVNISDVIMHTNEETIISHNNNKSFTNRKRSGSLESEETTSAKRKTPSPEPAAQVENEQEKSIAEAPKLDLEQSVISSDSQENEDISIRSEDINVDKELHLSREPVEFEEIVKTDEEKIVNFEAALDTSEECDKEVDEENNEDVPIKNTVEDTEKLQEEEEEVDSVDGLIEEEVHDPIIAEELNQESSRQFDECTPTDVEPPKYEESFVEHSLQTPSEEIAHVTIEDVQQIEQESSYFEPAELTKQETCISNVETEHEPFPMLPNSLILQQQAIILEKGPCLDNCGIETCMEDSAEKLEASVEESDLVRDITEDDANEDRFIDAENYVLESGQIELPISDKIPKEDHSTNLHETIFTTAQENWGVVDSSTEKLLEVPLHALESVPVGMVSAGNTSSEHVEVIPMKEELEVRLEEGTFPVPSDWPYAVKINPDLLTTGIGTAENGTAVGETSIHARSYPEFSGNQVKLELEVTLTPEIPSTDSLVISSASNSSNATVTSAVSKAVATVIPPTTIVCLPSVVSTAPMSTQQIVVSQTTPRPGMVQSSSAIPYMQLSTSQPIRAVATHSKSKTTSKPGPSSNRNRSSNKPPPGAVNLERSYQICQAVIQNSPNRDQLRCQLKPPPSLLAAAANNTTKKSENNRPTQYGNISSSRNNSKTFTPPLPASGVFQMVSGGNGIKTVAQKARVTYQQRQPSPPVVVRHVFTSGQGIPVTMAVLPQAQTLSPEVVEGQASVGQYILVQRAGVNDHQNIPRSSSAPPTQQQVPNSISTGSTPQVVSVGTRGRPASVEIDHPAVQQQQHQQPPPQQQTPADFFIQCPNPGTQAVTRRRLPQGVVYGDVSVESQLSNYTIIGENVVVDHPTASMQSQMIMAQKGVQMKSVNSNVTPGSDSSCPCNLKAMVMCKKCGAFCHDDCIGPNKLCRTCFIR